MTHLGMDVRICEDVRPEHSQWFPVDRFPEFTQVVPCCLATRRAEWLANFGTAQFPAKTHEVYERIILPRCKPITGSRIGKAASVLTDSERDLEPKVPVGS